jgi:site-specific DNA-methyltransferase (adenine-specific)
MHEFVPLTAIQLEDRQRKYFDLSKLIELADDIATNGLLHAPVVRDDGCTLVAGERRLRAIEMLHDTERQFMYAGEPVPFGAVPVVRAHGRQAVEWLEAELAENVIRADLTWQERSAAVAALHRLRQRQHPTWTPTDTAKELQTTAHRWPNAVHDEIRIADHLQDPEVASAKTIKDAQRIVERKARLQKAKQLAQEFDLTVSKSPHAAYRDAAIGTMRCLSAGTFDLLLTDPPYGINAQDFGTQNILGHQYDDSPQAWSDLMTGLANESYRLCRDEASAYVFCDITRFLDLQYFFALAGWDCWPRPLIWAKGNGILPKPDFGPRYTYEAILFATKGSPKYQAPGAPDVIQIPAPVLNRIHGAEKPVGLYLELMRRSSLPGDSVLDPFMGSGTIFPAANLAKLRATGIELNEDFYHVAVSRLEGTQ